ncbi:hypothetical protein BC830DRAFT_1175276 [Chytriomyces sp. MP71]|nr:hypothetical protein BC830DRAFT_1175276 [Chytriomyces sp. MP71]
MDLRRSVSSECASHQKNAPKPASVPVLRSARHGSPGFRNPSATLPQPFPSLCARSVLCLIVAEKDEMPAPELATTAAAELRAAVKAFETLSVDLLRNFDVDAANAFAALQQPTVHLQRLVSELQRASSCGRLGSGTADQVATLAANALDAAHTLTHQFAQIQPSILDQRMTLACVVWSLGASLSQKLDLLLQASLVSIPTVRLDWERPECDRATGASPSATHGPRHPSPIPTPPASPPATSSGTSSCETENGVASLLMNASSNILSVSQSNSELRGCMVRELLHVIHQQRGVLNNVLPSILTYTAQLQRRLAVKTIKSMEVPILHNLAGYLRGEDLVTFAFAIGWHFKPLGQAVRDAAALLLSAPLSHLPAEMRLYSPWARRQILNTLWPHPTFVQGFFTVTNENATTLSTLFSRAHICGGKLFIRGDQAWGASLAPLLPTGMRCAHILRRPRLRPDARTLDRWLHAQKYESMSLDLVQMLSAMPLVRICTIQWYNTIPVDAFAEMPKLKTLELN